MLLRSVAPNFSRLCRYDERKGFALPAEYSHFSLEASPPVGGGAYLTARTRGPESKRALGASPRARGEIGKLVELMGLEPTTSRMPFWRSPS